MLATAASAMIFAANNWPGYLASTEQVLGRMPIAMETFKHWHERLNIRLEKLINIHNYITESSDDES